MIGIGHRFRGDDAAGPEVADRVTALAPLGVAVLEHHGEGSDLMERWQGYAVVALVDAMRSGAPIGTIRRFDGAEPLPAPWFPNSSHLFGVAQAIELARTLDRLPPKLLVWGIEGARFDLGAGLSPAVAQAVETVAAEVASVVSPTETAPGRDRTGNPACRHA